MIELDKLVDSGRFGGAHSDMKPFVLLLSGLVVASDAKLVFEVGTGVLNSTRAFLHGLEKTGGKIISCDPAKLWKDFAHPQFQFIQKTSNEVAKTWQGQIDILFIDGDHGYEQVLFDYRTFAPFVKKDGLIIFHDVRHPPLGAFPGPRKVSEEAKETRRLVFEKSPGLTVFQKI